MNFKERNTPVQALIQIFEWLYGSGRILAISLIIGFSVSGAWLVYETGGTMFAYLHVLYVPILLSAFLFGVRGGVAMAVLAGLLVGPIMPLDVGAGTSQPLAGWLFRTGFFLLIGLVAGSLAALLHVRWQNAERLADYFSGVYARMLRTCALTVALRDEETAGHCERVAENARTVGKALGLPEPELEILFWAGVLHDVGKIAIPESILLKPGPLTAGEYEQVQRHAQAGAELLLSVSDSFGEVASAVRTHHERWDGAGYPDGLKGKEIPLIGRILSVVDVFEALTSNRPYREALPPADALDYLSAEAGTQFDAALVATFVGLYEQRAVLTAATMDSAKTPFPVTFDQTAAQLLLERE